ncbi:MAG TPA: nucleotidyltransferase family protein [Casimicrobiaceae bacterium]|nr:nucleotidyltransferase family protein [Casimicrobiaceae bacterium]
MNAGTKSRGTPAVLVQAILDPRSLARLDAPDWERLLSCARRNAVLAYLAERAAAAGIIDDLQEQPRAGLLAARMAAARLAQLARWELDRVRRVLRPAAIPMIALKGVAYILRGMPHASTRLLSDVDVMVPRDRIEDAEQALLTAGWKGTTLDPYDQRYYRKWSHEIPPLRYPGRMLDVDMHHTICPPVSRLRPDPEQFWANSEPSADAGIRLLSPVDSVLHAAVHLFFDSDFNGRFRDLLDLHELLAAFGAKDAFWSALLARAREQGLGRPLYYAFATLSSVLGTPIPPWALRQARQFRPPPLVNRWMTRTLNSVLTPADPERWPPAHRGRLWLLYVRSHWTRMPAHLLFPHLVRKSARRVHAAAVDA